MGLADERKPVNLMTVHVSKSVTVHEVSNTNKKQMGEIEFDKEKKIFNILNQVNDSRISNQAYENWASEQILKIMFRNDGQFPDVTSVEK